MTVSTVCTIQLLQPFKSAFSKWIISLVSTSSWSHGGIDLSVPPSESHVMTITLFSAHSVLEIFGKGMQKVPVGGVFYKIGPLQWKLVPSFTLSPNTLTSLFPSGFFETCQIVLSHTTTQLLVSNCLLMCGMST